MTTGFLMGYSPSDAFGAPDAADPLFVDHTFQRVYNSVQASGVRYCDAYPNGVEIVGRTISDLKLTAAYGPVCFLYNSQRIAIVQSRSNSSAITYLDATTLTWSQVFGSNNSSFTNGSFNVETPNQICSIVGPFGNDCIVCNTQYADTVINCIDTSANANRFTVNTTENSACVGSVPDGSGSIAFILGYTKLGGSTANGLYTLNALGTLTRLASITPASIDATWTNFAQSVGVSVDQTDGNPICGFATTDSVTHRAYICKFNKTTGALIWAIPVAGNPGVINYGAKGMANNLIKNGTLWYLGTDSGYPLFKINTVAGTFTTSALSAAALDGTHGEQCSEDVTNSLYWFGSWSETSTHPAYLGDYCLVKGNTSGSQIPWRYFPGPAFVAPVPGIPAGSRKRAWTFTFDGHVFYVLDLGAEGTYLYDDTTEQWSKWVTQGLNQWNLCNGTMWGVRVVGGDVLNTTLWEMQPAALLDNGVTPIQHIVTGGLAKRTRVYSSVESLRLNLSVGQIDEAGASVQLAFSDDQGKTWFYCDTYTLLAGDYSDEIAWNSLGAFAAPGRIFQVIDIGGFLRIDGMDAMLDNFDEDGNTATKDQ